MMPSVHGAIWIQDSIFKNWVPFFDSLASEFSPEKIKEVLAQTTPHASPAAELSKNIGTAHATGDSSKSVFLKFGRIGYSH
jgi:hypothetical protein